MADQFFDVGATMELTAGGGTYMPILPPTGKTPGGFLLSGIAILPGSPGNVLDVVDMAGAAITFSFRVFGKQ